MKRLMPTVEVLLWSDGSSSGVHAHENMVEIGSGPENNLMTNTRSGKSAM